ncbi:RNA-binding protein [Siphonobacter sp. BAB-5405]|uniref:VCBS repeat-containing protein n=1 Tax=Siphonobacter sp. BAB-5405 TaxID=1864825 RepID=UPI000C7F9835|nr:VCBS repeat-containing protein [Siphonobacter sp. BAB-5405]PMD94429.1 RNA-binding protein [Siphonobacter sp. BAB-5405]
MNRIIPLSLLVLLLACQQKSEKEVIQTNTGSTLFKELTTDQTHVDFSNTLTEGLNTNILMYEYFYNGGGVAVGDLNNDGLEDLYFTANMTPNKLYLNQGKLQFKDITDASGAAGRPGPWKTGVTMADVNGDGKLDIYVCYSGSVAPENRTNQLFINQGVDGNGIPQFKESAREYGLDSPATSTQGVFFDYDKDGDLDLFLLNHNPKSLPVLDEAATTDLLKKEDTSAGSRLYRNDTNHFIDITAKAGIQSTALSYGLGAGVADINGDGWLDLYIGNDYTIPDFLYINNHNGTFTNQIQKQLQHTSHFSMGNDIADINNDGFPDIYTLDMLPEDNKRQKLLMAPDNYEKFDLNLRSGFYYQYMRNMLQLNNGNGTFSEIGQLSGLSNTDWSWASLFADYDNDGWKDLFVTNGFPRDYTNLDFSKYMGDFMKNRQGNIHRQDVLNLVQQIPASNVSNYLFKNNGNLTFSNVSATWGVNQPLNSNGAAFSDLDNDGDLDLVINNINHTASLYENQSDRKHHFLNVKLEGKPGNTQGIGAKVMITAKGQRQYLDQMPTRGYQSSVSPVLHFGLQTATQIDSLTITWPDGSQETKTALKADQLLTLKQKDAAAAKIRTTAPGWYQSVPAPVAFQSASTSLNDFKRQPLLVNPLSFSGPCLAKADVNGDGKEDLFVGGGNGQAGVLFLQQANGKLSKKQSFNTVGEDADALFFDANRDGFPDLYLVSGGYGDLMPEDPRLQDRLYLNDGKGNFTKATGALPTLPGSKSCVRAADLNDDGALDLFVGGRVIPGRYPETPPSFLLINDGKGHFSDQTAKLAPALARMGMVSDAAWLDLNQDQKPDLILVGEWMPVTAFVSNGSTWTDQTSTYFPKAYRGWWNKLLLEDINGDGRMDLLVGNQGLNTQCKVSDREPAELVYKDFDDNGSIDPILSFYIQGKSYPYVTRDELLDQISMMRTRFPDYKSYAETTLTDIFTPEELEGSTKLSANTLKTTLFVRTAKGNFQEQALPIQTQMAPVFTITSLDFDQDGKKDLLLCGNVNKARLRFGNCDANYGVLLKGNGKGQFQYVPQQQSGFALRGDVRSVLPWGNQLLIGINQKGLQAYQRR